MTDAPPASAALSPPPGAAAPVPSRRAAGMPSHRHSVYAEAERHADVHKWIESERAGRDLGEEALRQWARLYWRHLLRACWLEHLRGERYWSEVDRGDYGMLADGAGGLLGEVVALLRRGGENLDVIVWARDTGADVEQVLVILEGLDVNSRRLPHRFDL
jgi:hypothetical protein